MIIESVVTTVDSAGKANIAPMGAVVSDDLNWNDCIGQTFQLRPFEPSQTLDNLRQVRHGVLNFTDDVFLIAQSALNQLSNVEAFVSTEGAEPTTICPALQSATSYYRFEVQSMQQHGKRWFLNCRISEGTTVRTFAGFNRAQFAIIEATITATRLSWIPQEVVDQQLSQLGQLIEKTGGEKEKMAWVWLLDWIQENVPSGSSISHRQAES